MHSRQSDFYTNFKSSYRRIFSKRKIKDVFHQKYPLNNPASVKLCPNMLKYSKEVLRPDWSDLANGQDRNNKKRTQAPKVAGDV